MSDREAIDKALEELERTRTERTLDEALDEIDRWKEKARQDTEGLSPSELRAHYDRVVADFEKLLGHPLKKAVRQPRFKVEE